MAPLERYVKFNLHKSWTSSATNSTNIIWAIIFIRVRKCDTKANCNRRICYALKYIHGIYLMTVRRADTYYFICLFFFVWSQFDESLILNFLPFVIHSFHTDVLRILNQTKYCRFNTDTTAKDLNEFDPSTDLNDIRLLDNYRYSLTYREYKEVKSNYFFVVVPSFLFTFFVCSWLAIHDELRNVDSIIESLQWYTICCQLFIKYYNNSSNLLWRSNNNWNRTISTLQVEKFLSNKPITFHLLMKIDFFCCCVKRWLIKVIECYFFKSVFCILFCRIMGSMPTIVMKMKQNSLNTVN